MSDINAIIEHATAIRHDIHQHPELAHEEVRTAQVIRTELDRLGISWRPCANTGTIADLAPSAAGPMIALRADIDALPLKEASGVDYPSTIEGKMHACGHDGHTASLLATAAWLKKHEDALPQPVRLLWQPAEEGGHGAARMIEDGALEGVSEIYGYHNWPQLPYGTVSCVSGPFMAANGYYTATIHGRGGHASQPENCVNPVSVAAEIVPLLHQMTSQRLAPQDSGVVSVSTFHAGTAENIIADYATIGGTIRALTTEVREQLATWITETITQVAERHGGRAEVSYNPAYPATVNHDAPTAKAKAALESLDSVTAFSTAGIPVMGSEDFAYYAEKIPANYIFLGGGFDDDKPIEVCHSPRYRFNDKLIAQSTAYFAAIVGAPLP